MHWRSWSALLSVAVAACGALVPAPTLSPSDRALRVLYISTRVPGLVPPLRQALAAAGRKPLPGPLADVEVMQVQDRADAAQRLQQMGAGIERFDALFVNSISMARVVQMAVPQIPIVFQGVDDPVNRCLVDSLQRPGRNATGYMHYLPGDDLRALQVLHEAFPDRKEVHVLLDHDGVVQASCDPNDPFWRSIKPSETCVAGPRQAIDYAERRFGARDMVAMAHELGITLVFHAVCDLSDLDRLAQLPTAARADVAWLVTYQDLFDRNRQRVVDALNATGQPAIYEHAGYVRMGGVMALSAIEDTGVVRPSMRSIVQVLRGGSPSVLPVQMPRGFETSINVRTAARLGLQPSLQALRVADHVLH